MQNWTRPIDLCKFYFFRRSINIFKAKIWAIYNKSNLVLIYNKSNLVLIDLTPWNLNTFFPAQINSYHCPSFLMALCSLSKISLLLFILALKIFSVYANFKYLIFISSYQPLEVNQVVKDLILKRKRRQYLLYIYNLIILLFSEVERLKTQLAQVGFNCLKENCDCYWLCIYFVSSFEIQHIMLLVVV